MRPRAAQRRGYKFQKKLNQLTCDEHQTRAAAQFGKWFGMMKSVIQEQEKN
jgi:hypothetical protein